MKAYVVIESCRDWESGWDNLCGIFLSEDKAILYMVGLIDKNTDDTITYSIQEEEIFE